MTKILCAVAMGMMLVPLGGCTDLLSNDLSLKSDAMRNTMAQAFAGTPATAGDAARPGKTGTANP